MSFVLGILIEAITLIICGLIFLGAASDPTGDHMPWGTMLLSVFGIGTLLAGLIIASHWLKIAW